MRFIKTTRVLGASLITMGFAAGFGQTVKAQELGESFYNVRQLCGGDKYIDREIYAKIETFSNPQAAVLMTVTRSGAFKVVYEGVFTEDGGTTVNADACLATVDDVEVPYDERLTLDGPDDATLYDALSTVVEAKQALFSTEDMSTYTCAYLFQKLEGAQEERAARKFPEMIPLCVD